MFCPECGKKNEEGINFCENCGTRLSEVEIIVPTTEEISKDSLVSETLQFEDEMTAPVKKKGKLGTYLKVFGIEAIVLVLALFAFVFAFQKRFGVKETVERYYEAREEGDWNRVYELLYTKEWKGELLDKAAFVTAKSINEEKGDQIRLDRVRVLHTSMKEGKAKVYFTKKEDGKEVEEEVRIRLVRQGFSWKIEDESDLEGPVEIQVPEKSKVLLDKVEISKSLKPERKKGVDTYEVLELFGKKHYLEVSGKGMKTVKVAKDLTKVTEVKSGKEKSVTKIGKSFDDKTLQTVSNQAIQDYQSIMGGASTNKGISEVPALNNMYGEKKDNSIQRYEDFRNQKFFFDDKYYEQKLLKLTNSEAKASNQEHNGEKMVRVEVASDFYHQYVNTFWSRDEEVENKGKIETVLWYIKDGKEWKLYEVEFPNL